MHELYEFDQPLRHTIADNPHTMDFEKIFTSNRILSLQEAIWRKVKYGVTGIEELFKITRT